MRVRFGLSVLSAAAPAMRRVSGHLAGGVRTVVAGFLIVSGIGATPSPVRAAQQIDHDKAWIDARSMCLFRLGGAMPRNPQELSTALVAGWQNSIALPDSSRAISIEGADYPAIGALRIDLSSGRVKVSNRKDRIRVNNKVEQDLRVGRLEVRGEPLLVRRAKIHMSLVADGAHIDLERDRRGRPVMMLADARSGSLSFDVTQADAESLLLQSARESASHYGVTIERMHLHIDPETPRSVQATLHVFTWVGPIPAGLVFKAHMTVDDAMNARISGLTVDGDEALGPLIVNFLRPGLQKYNGQTRRLMSFPAGNLQLRDVAVRVDDSLHLTAAFGS